METPSLLRRPRAAHARSRAFTLIELLTVIAIIGILAAILIPTVGKVRAMAKKTQCVSNLRQWGTAVRLFANDHKGTVLLYNKDVEEWALYAPYFSQKFMTAPDGQRKLSQIVMSRCPVSYGLTTTDSNYRSREYAFVRPVLPANAVKDLRGVNFGISDVNRISTYNLSDALSPSRLVLMTEVFPPDNAHYILAGAGEFATHVKPMQVNTTNSSAVRHSGLANMLFLDGHVSSFTPSQTDFGVPANKPTILSWMTLR